MPRTYFRDWPCEDGSTITVEHTFTWLSAEVADADIVKAWKRDTGEPVSLSVEGAEAVVAHIILTHGME